MEYHAIPVENEFLKKQLRHTHYLVMGLMVITILLGYMLFWSLSYQKRTIIPMTVTQPFTVSDHFVDSSYLQQMAIAFIEEHLDLTPDTVDANNQLLLQYTDADFYSQFQKVLDDEAEMIKKDKVSSSFSIGQMIVHPEELTVTISGVLQRMVGEVALEPAKKTYLLQFNYQKGVLTIHSFSEIIKQNDGTDTSSENDHTAEPKSST